VNLHELLKVEEGEIIVLAHPQEFAEGRVRLDVTLIGRILKVLALAVSVDVLGDIRAGDESVFLETEELAHLIGYWTRLGKSRLRSVGITRLASALAVDLFLRNLVVAMNLLLELLKASLKVADSS